MRECATTKATFATPGRLGAADVAVESVALDVAAVALPGLIDLFPISAQIGAVRGSLQFAQGPELAPAGPAAVVARPGAETVCQPVEGSVKDVGGCLGSHVLSIARVF